MQPRLHPNRKYLVRGIVLLVGGALLMSSIYIYVAAVTKYGASYNNAPPENIWVVIAAMAGALCGLPIFLRGVTVTFFLSCPEDEMMVAP